MRVAVPAWVSAISFWGSNNWFILDCVGEGGWTTTMASWQAPSLKMGPLYCSGPQQPRAQGSGRLTGLQQIYSLGLEAGCRSVYSGHRVLLGEAQSTACVSMEDITH